MNIAIIGGGISGIRAALTLAKVGSRVTLFEKNQHLGGRVFSYSTPDFGEIDIGQHIWLRGCTALERLLDDLAVPDEWIYRQDRVAMTYRWPDGFVRKLVAGPWPGSLSLLPFLLRARLSLIDKLKHAWGMQCAKGYSDATVETFDNLPMAEWLQAHHQPPAVTQWFWEPLIVGVCNGRLSEVSARHGLFVVRESLLKSPRNAAICLLRRPLSEVFDRHTQKQLRQAGVDVQIGVSVRDVQLDSATFVHLADGQKLAFDKIILAMPLKYMRTLLPNTPLPEPPEEGAIAGLLLKFARPVMEELFFTAVGSPVQIVFNKSAIWGNTPSDGSQVIELVLSAAEREVRLGVENVTEELLPDLTKLLPEVSKTPLLAKRLLVHGTATFRVKPGGEPNRLPFTRPELPNIIFAGDYAATGWPSTMESAARAGQAAAEEVLRNQNLGNAP